MLSRKRAIFEENNSFARSSTKILENDEKSDGNFSTIRTHIATMSSDTDVNGIGLLWESHNTGWEVLRATRGFLLRTSY